MTKAVQLSADIKECRRCHTEKPIEDFVRSKAYKSGIDTICVQCNRNKVTEWRASGKRNAKQEYSNYTKKYPGKIAAYARLRRSMDPIPSRIASAKSRVNRERRLVKWDIELTNFVTSEAHKLRLLRNKITRFSWHVDHIIPLKGKVVSGLHVWNNLQVIPAEINQRKTNKYAE